MAYKEKTDLYSLLRGVSSGMTRGTRQEVSARPGQNKVVKILNQRENIRQRELQDILGIRASSLSELLRKLEKDEYITRRRSDTNGSEIIISITEKGRIAAIECEMAEAERDREFFGCLEEDEREELLRILNKLLANWHAADGETEGDRRERQWTRKTHMQEEAREIDEMLDRVARS